MSSQTLYRLNEALANSSKFIIALDKNKNYVIVERTTNKFFSNDNISDIKQTTDINSIRTF